jgi:osmoprotectant transport system ATP-binding protein
MIRFENVTKYHKGKKAPAVTALNLDIREGELCVLIGPSGCGKTSILKMINRLDLQDEGTISVDGSDIGETDVVSLRRRIGFMMQNAALFPHRTVEANIAAVPHLLKWDKEKTRRRVVELMDLVGLPPELAGRYPSQLSGGQQSRVALARALASDPPVILMDEPFSALDPLIRERLQDELVSLQKRLHKTIVLVTHDMEEAIKLADRIAVFEEEGKLVQFDTPKNILAYPASPFVQQFVGNDPSLKRLALMKVSELEEPESAAPRLDSAAETRLAHVSPALKLVLNDQHQPISWLSDSHHPAPRLTLVSGTESLHHALLKILSTPSGVIVQVDDDGKYTRCISTSHLYDALHDPQREVVND